MTSSRYYPILGTLLSPALVATLAGLETASLELNAHLRVQPAHCVYDFYFLSDFSTMPYRRPYKRARYAKRDKYSIQQKAIEFQTANETSTAKVEIVPGTDVEGMRKIKHLTVSVASETNNGAFYWALVYVPQGTTPGNLAVNIITGTTGMYEPNQFVMNCGVVDPEAGPIRFTSPVSRNLNDGDAIYLLVKNTNVDGPITYNAVVRYAITLQ